MLIEQRRENLRVAIARAEEQLLRWERVRLTVASEEHAHWQQTAEEQVRYLKGKVRTLRARLDRLRSDGELELA